MSSDYLPFVDTPKRPVFRPPAGACDAHCHVFGPAATFPFAPDRTYTPVDAPASTLFELHRLLGIERGVLVQASCHGTDNRAMLDAIAAFPDRYRGVAMVPADADRQLLLGLEAAGVRALRFNFVRHLGADAEHAAVVRLAPLLAGIGWHVVIHLDAERLVDLAAILRSLPVTVVIDHMARVDASRGLDQAPFRLLLDLLDDEKFWVKISGVERLTRCGPPYEDAVPFARRLVEDFTDRVLWGTDWPHPNVRAPMPDDGELVDLLPLIARTSRQQHALLVENPGRLYWPGE